MLTHIVCWKYKPEVTAEKRAEHIAKLKDLPNIIEQIITFNVGADFLHLDRSFDTGLSSTFADKAALDAYTVHPAHQEIVAFGKEISAQVVSVDFLSD